jgi:hypothetical protein
MKTKGRRATISVQKLTLPGEKTPKSNPGPPGWGLDIGLATRFRKNKFSCEISIKPVGYMENEPCNAKG